MSRVAVVILSFKKRQKQTESGEPVLFIRNSLRAVVTEIRNYICGVMADRKRHNITLQIDYAS